MSPGLRHPLRIALAALFAVALLAYGLFEARHLLAGPVLIIESPRLGQASEALVTLAGSTKNIADIALNGRKIFVDGEGRFREQLLLSYGYNILTLSARDRFGRETEKTLELVYQ